MNTARTWVLVGNASEAKLFESQNIGRELHLVREYDHPTSRNKGQDFTTDRSGRFQGNNGTLQGAFISPSDPKETEMERFAKQLADDMESGRNEHLYDRLVVIMPPKCHGMFNKACNDQVLNKVIHHIEKDYTKMQDRELIDYLDDLARF